MIRVNQDLAYWIGVVQTDGNFEISTDKYGRTRHNVRLVVSPKSLPMLTKFKEISGRIFDRHSKIFKMKTQNHLSFKMGAAQFLKDFVILKIRFGDPPTPPEWIKRSPKLFGSYLSGVIDGDGNIEILKPKIKPQLAFRIFSGSYPEELQRTISDFFKISVSVKRHYRETFIGERYVKGYVYVTYFYLNKKDKDFFRRYVLPHITIPHKADKLKTFLGTENN